MSSYPDKGVGTNQSFSELRFFIGSYTKMGGLGVGMCSLCGNELHLICADALPNSTYVIQNRAGTRLYAICSDAADDAEGGSVAAYQIDGYKLRLISRINTIGEGPCHLCLDARERYLYTANYFSGSISAFALDAEGGIISCIQHIRHEGHSVHPLRQTAPYVHQVSFIPGTDMLCAVDLGIDKLVVYEQNKDTGMLTYNSSSQMPSGSGPRHLLYAPKNMAYLACEVDNKVAVLKWNGSTFDVLQVLSTLPENFSGENTAAAIRMRSGKVFVSNRGHDSIAVFDTDANGLLTLEDICKTSYDFPRDFDFVDDVTVLIGHQNGALTLEKFSEMGLELRSRLDIKGCVCVSVRQTY